MDSKLGKLSTLKESIHYSRCCIIQLYETTKDCTISKQIIRLDTDTSRIHLGLEKLKWLNPLSIKLETIITDFLYALPAHPMESIIAVKF